MLDKMPTERKYGIAIAIVGLVAILAIASIPASASGTIYVNTSDTNSAVTYDTIQNALDNASNGDTIKVASGTYEESYNVNTDNVTIEVYNSSNGDVIIDATNTTYGDAFYGDYAHNLTLGTNVSISQNVVYVDIAGTAEFTSIQDAVNSVNNGTTISIEPGSDYQESIDFQDKEDIALVNRYPNDGNVVINATETENGDAFVNETNLRVGAYITVEEDVYSVGGSITETANTPFIGIPLWVWAIAIVIVGFVVYNNEN